MDHGDGDVSRADAHGLPSPVVERSMQADGKPDLMRSVWFAPWIPVACLCLAACQTIPVFVEPVPGPPPPPPALTGPPAQDEAAINGRLAFEAGDFGLAERKYREAVEKNPEDAASWVGLAAAYDNLKRFDLADRAYGQAIRLGGVTVEILNNRGYSFLLRGDRARALAEFRLALEIDPNNPVILNNIQLLRLNQRPSRTVRL